MRVEQRCQEPLSELNVIKGQPLWSMPWIAGNGGEQWFLTPFSILNLYANPGLGILLTSL